MRAAFQVLVIPHCGGGHEILYACLIRADEGYVQFVAGGGEDEESPAEAALRELQEETGLLPLEPLRPLKSMASIPVDQICGRLWGPDVLMIPEHAFAAKVSHGQGITLSKEHLSFVWLPYGDALAALKWDSNAAALRELHALICQPPSS
jgi:dATP pyrophosphohydrolase